MSDKNKSTGGNSQKPTQPIRERVNNANDSIKHVRESYIPPVNEIPPPKKKK